MSVKFPFQIEIPRRSYACAKGQEELTPGSEYYSTVEESKDGRLVRQDFCPACWETLKHTKKTYWKSRVISQKVAANTQNKDERALELLREALKHDTPDDMAEAFVLALYLTRRRLLAYRQQMQQDNISLYEIVATEEMIGVRSVALSQLQVESLQTRIASKLCSASKSISV